MNLAHDLKITLRYCLKPVLKLSTENLSSLKDSHAMIRFSLLIDTRLKYEKKNIEKSTLNASQKGSLK